MASTPGSMDIMLSPNSKDLCSKHTDFNELLSKLKQKTQESWILYYSTQPFALHTYGVIGYRETVDVPKGTKRVSSYDFFHITRVTRITVWPDWVIVLWKKSSFNSSKIFSDFLGYFENITFQIKCIVATFWENLGNFFTNIWSHCSYTRKEKDMGRWTIPIWRCLDGSRSKYSKHYLQRYRVLAWYFLIMIKRHFCEVGHLMCILNSVLHWYLGNYMLCKFYIFDFSLPQLTVMTALV